MEPQNILSKHQILYLRKDDTYMKQKDMDVCHHGIRLGGLVFLDTVYASV